MKRHYEGFEAMWKILKNPLSKRMDSINVTEFLQLLESVPDKIIIFDVRDRSEINAYPRMIPQALLATDLSLSALMPWLPPEMWVVLYGENSVSENSISRDYETLRTLRPDARFRALKGGLRAWWEAQLETEPANLYPMLLREAP